MVLVWRWHDDGITIDVTDGFLMMALAKDLWDARGTHSMISSNRGHVFILHIFEKIPKTLGQAGERHPNLIFEDFLSISLLDPGNPAQITY